MLSLKQKLRKYQFFRLMIWRSLVQAQAGPHKRIAQMAVLFILRAWTFTACYLLRSWLAPTSFTPHNDAARTFLRFIPCRILCLFEILYRESIEKHK